MNISLHQGYQGPVVGCGVSLESPGPLVTITGGLALPRRTRLDWYYAHSSPFVFALDATSGVQLDGDGYVTSWVDPINTINAVAVPISAGPAYAPVGWSDNGPAIAFDGGVSRLLYQNYALPYLTAPKTLVFHVRPAGAGRTQALYSWQSAYNYAMFALDSQARFTVVNGGVQWSTPIGDPLFSAGEDTLIAYAMAEGVNASRIWCNGREIVIPVNMMPAGIGNLVSSAIGLAASPAGKYFGFDGLMRRCSLSMAPFDASDYKCLTALVLGCQYANVVCDGNSLTQAGWPSVMANRLGASLGKCSVYNAAFGGATTLQLRSLLPTVVGVRKRNACRNLLVIWEVSNDLFYNHPCTKEADIPGSARVLVDNLWGYVRDASALGFEVIVVTPTLRTGYSNNQKKCAALASQLIRLEYQEKGAVSCVCPDLVPALNNPNDPIFFADGTHYTPVGYTVLNSLFTAAVAARIETGTP